MTWRGGLVLATLGAFGLRTHELAAVPLRWDEGWSVALASLSIREMLTITSLDVHPPLYYLALMSWTEWVGVGDFVTRFPSAAVATLAAPLAAVAAKALFAASGSGAAANAPVGADPVGVVAPAARLDPAARLATGVGLVAAAFAAMNPALVYYGGVARMYAFAVPLLLLATWGLVRLARSPGRVLHGRDWVEPLPAAAAVLGSAGAVLTFYYAGFALAGLALVLLIFGRHRVWIVLAGVAAGTVAGPWLLRALPELVTRISDTAASRSASPTDVMALMVTGWKASLLAEADPVGWGLPTLAVGLGLAVAVWRSAARGQWRRRLVPFAAVLGAAIAVLAAAAAGAQAHMFAARYTLVAAPFVGLAVALSIGTLVAAWPGRRTSGHPAAIIGTALVVTASAPALTGFVYERSLEVHDAYDPAADWSALRDAAGPDDVVAFNILSLAGFYERYRSATDPGWTFAQLWDPVHEPLGTARARIARAAEAAPRLWLVLYQGTYAEDTATLKAWADDTFYPAEGWWGQDRLYQSYLAIHPDTGASPEADFGHGVHLADATYTSRSHDGGVAVALQWVATRRPDADGKVFVHLYDSDGELVAQHDAFPAHDTRPPTSWRAGESVVDRRGLLIPDAATGPFDLRVGIYDPATGDRWSLPDGRDTVHLGTVRRDPH